MKNICLETNEQREAGYWKSGHSKIWYEKTYKKPYRDYKKDEMRIYNWSLVEDEKAIEMLEDGLVPSYAALCGHDNYADV